MSVSLPNYEPCTLSEYQYYLEERVLEEVLSVNGLYLLMVKQLEGMDAFIEALRCPVKIETLAKEEDLVRVEFNLLDQKLQPVGLRAASMNDGMLSVCSDDYSQPEVAYFRTAGLIDPSSGISANVSEAVHARAISRDRERELATV